MEPGIRGILVLAALCSFLSPLLGRKYHFIYQPRGWYEAQEYCRKNLGDLVTINYVQELEALAAQARYGGYLFLGLHRGWVWSNSFTDDYKEGEQAYWNWADGEPPKPGCGSIGPTGEWFATNCSSESNFFCYDASASDVSERFILKHESANWTTAQERCRNQHTDLARVRSQQENQELQRFVKGGLVWIGLGRLSWMWSDRSYLSFTPWEGFRPHDPGLADCAAINLTSNSIEMMKCDEPVSFVCYKDPMSKHVVSLKLFADDSSVYMNDPDAMESILEQVKKELMDNGAFNDINVYWRKLPEKRKTQNKGNRGQEQQRCRFKNIE